MQLNTISENLGGKKSKRLGRGIGSGHGKTSCKGHKGQWARSGGGVRPGFEGGQMPLTRRLPKRGFHNVFGTAYSVLNVGALEKCDKIADGARVDAALLLEAGLLSKVEKDGVKILGSGTLNKKLTVVAAKFTEAAKAAIEKAGGTAEAAKAAAEVR